MTITFDATCPFSLDEEIAVAEKELRSAIRYARTREADFDQYGVGGTPHLAALTERLELLRQERREGC